MNTLSLTTPGLLFSAISLLLLAYTNRFLALAALIRTLHDKYQREHTPIIIMQIRLLRKRVRLIRSMQFLGVASLFLCVLCMFLLFGEHFFAGKIVFGIGLLFLLASLGISIYEIHISTNALNLQLENIEKEHKESTI